jgi:hypothetical protein
LPASISFFMSSYLSSSANSDYPLDAAGSRTPNSSAVGVVSGVVRERTNFRSIARRLLFVPAHVEACVRLPIALSRPYLFSR